MRQDYIVALNAKTGEVAHAWPGTEFRSVYNGTGIEQHHISLSESIGAAKVQAQLIWKRLYKPEQFNIPVKEYYYVVRTHSHTDRQMLWKVFSRRLDNAAEAFSWKKFCESEEKNKKHKYFVIKKQEEIEN